jgi:hypothetical protein
MDKRCSMRRYFRIVVELVAGRSCASIQTGFLCAKDNHSGPIDERSQHHGPAIRSPGLNTDGITR